MSQGNTESSNAMRGNSDPFPVDLVTEIFSWLPAKSVAKFRCVSKQMESILRGPNFAQLFLTRSSARPRLLFAFERAGVWRFFSFTHPQNLDQKSSSSLVVAADFEIEFPPEAHMEICCTTCRRFSCGYASGSIFFSGMYLSETSQEDEPVVCNPITGQYLLLPYFYRYRKSYGFFGFDPIDNQSKALFMAYPCGPDKHKILTLGDQNATWRTIECPLRHDPLTDCGICIDGVVYYLADHSDYLEDHAPYDENAPAYLVVVCFDVRSEEFKFVKAESSYDKLVYYEGKLRGISLEYAGVGKFPLKLNMWTLEDVEKQEWSKDVYTVWDENEVCNAEHTNLSVLGMTATGDVVMCRYYTSNPFYVFYFNLESKTLQRVEIQGVGEFHQEFDSHVVYAFVDHVEDLNVIDAKLLKSSPTCKPRKKPQKRPEHMCDACKQKAAEDASCCASQV